MCSDSSRAVAVTHAYNDAMVADTQMSEVWDSFIGLIGRPSFIYIHGQQVATGEITLRLEFPATQQMADVSIYKFLYITQS